LCNIYIIRKRAPDKIKIMTGFVLVHFGQNLTNFFLKLAIIGRLKQQNHSHWADEPQGGSSISRDKSAAKWANQVKQLQPSHVDFAMRPSAEFYRLRVQGSFRYRLISSVMARGFPTVWSKIWFQNISRSWTSKLLANWLISCIASRLGKF
jgi:hypothetical protein